MSNAIFIDVNKIENVITKTIYYAIEVWDNYNSGSTCIEKEEIPKTDIEALRYCKDISSDIAGDFCDVIDVIEEYEIGVTINGTFYSWDEIKHIFGVK